MARRKQRSLQINSGRLHLQCTAGRARAHYAPHTHPACAAAQWCGFSTARLWLLHLTCSLPLLLLLPLVLPLLLPLLLRVCHKLHWSGPLAAAPAPRRRCVGRCSGAARGRRAPEAGEVVGALLLQPLLAADLLRRRRLCRTGVLVLGGRWAGLLPALDCRPGGKRRGKIW